VLHYALAPRGLAQVLWLGTTDAPVALCAGCDLGTEFAVVWPAAALRTVLPCEASLVGAQWFTQGADLGIGTCPIGGMTVALSNTVRTAIGN
jgi:hypothetical protein